MATVTQTSDGSLLEKYEEAKKEAQEEETNYKLRKAGFKAQNGGAISFPGLNSTKIDIAERNNLLAQKTLKPKVKISLLSIDGKIKMKFNQPMMFPKKISNEILDNLFTVSVTSNRDDITH